MNHDDIDRLLASEDEIVPSPEFLDSVMQAVEREPTPLPPLEFPWLRMLPGLVAAIVAVIAVIWHGIGVLSNSALIEAFNDQIPQLLELVAGFGLPWIVLALGITVVSITLSTSLVARTSRI